MAQEQRSRSKRIVDGIINSVSEPQLPSTSGSRLNIPTISFSDFDSDDSVYDADYELPKRSKPRINFCLDDSTDSFDNIFDANSPEIMDNCTVQNDTFNALPLTSHASKEQEKNANIFAPDSSDLDSIPDSQSYHSNIIIPESPTSSNDSESELEKEVMLTKKGTIRKRKKYTTTQKERKLKKLETKKCNKYSVKTGCNPETCKRKCTTIISEEQRKIINNNFGGMTWREQKIFFISSTSQKTPKRPKDRTNDTDDIRRYNRSKTVTYYLQNENGTQVQVCRTFFLTTLGFKGNNSKSVRNALDAYFNGDDHTNPIESLVDKRGTNPNPHKIDTKAVITHIMSFHPTVSHYRRVHAPNKRYLPSDLSVKKMYDNFCENNCQTEFSYDFYRKVLKSQNISFAKLGHEECESCEKFLIHNPNPEIRHRNCKNCKDYEAHHKRYISARAMYKADADKQTNNQNEPDTIYFAVDLQKVIMLPRMEEFKTVMFCPRLIAFNESFVPLGDKKIHESCTGHTVAVLWHEAISGRKKEDIISCFRAFFMEYRDLKHIILWLDNCAGQNKNWALFSYLIYLVNSNEVNLDTITLRYLESGHTFMAADEFHHRVENSMKSKKRIFDFEDFCKAVSDVNRNVVVKKMAVQDFHDFEDCLSMHKIQHSCPRVYMSEITEAVFKRGSLFMSYKNNHSSESRFYEVDFLKQKHIKMGIPPPRQKSVPRGITSERKMNIINKLGPLMPINRLHFWENLAVNDNTVDLIHHHED